MKGSLENARTLARRLFIVPVAAFLFAAGLAGCSSTRPGATGWGGRVEDVNETPENMASSPTGSDNSTYDSHGAAPEAGLTPAVAQIQLFDILSTELHLWMGTPHTWGGASLSGVDCSGLIQSVYRDAFNVSLPRTTSELEKIGIAVKRSELKTGDLVFFRPDGSGKHVGIYMANRDFIHSSSSRGVMRSSLDETYWDRYYHKSRRVLRTDAQLVDAVAYAHRMTEIRSDFQSN